MGGGFGGFERGFWGFWGFLLLFGGKVAVARVIFDWKGKCFMEYASVAILWLIGGSSLAYYYALKLTGATDEFPHKFPKLFFLMGYIVISMPISIIIYGLFEQKLFYAVLVALVWFLIGHTISLLLYKLFYQKKGNKEHR
ncbi:MAG TPA: hypothetical protein VLL52_04710 [Anaerolineae bacterium]|nr:hypothetical protein [Anaerolineae bacterium]